ncbi:MAG TPA: alpha/beta fold hydrolase [Solirubrobacterales bacterium]|nr:alpha/beta fold hydrolase [Solirubrobacterales bacterium]
MSRRRKFALGTLLALAGVLALNAIVVSGDTEGPEITVPGGRLLDLQGGRLQVLDRGPRSDAAIVLIHGFTCSIRWWEATIPPLEDRHRVIAVDLLGHGGSEKPADGYSMQEQAQVVTAALERLGVRRATVVGHSLGAVVAIAMAELAPRLVERIVVLDQAPDSDGYGADLPLTAALTFQPVIGEALWRLAPNASIEDGLSVGFAPGYDVPDEFIDDFRRLTYTAYDESAAGESEYTEQEPLDSRLRRIGVPTLAVFGAEEQIYDPWASLAAYRTVPGVKTALVRGAGHSPNVERPVSTAKLISHFALSSGHGGRLPAATRAGGADRRTKKGRPEGRP